MKKLITQLGPILAGGVGGFVAMQLASGPAPAPGAAVVDDPQTLAVAPAPAQPVGVARLDTADAERLRALEARVDDGLAEIEQSVQDAEERRDPFSPEREQTVEEYTAEMTERWRDTLARHEGDVVDPVFAEDASASFAADFDEVLEHTDIEFLGVDCRSTSCTASIEWGSFGAAQQGFENLLHHDYEKNCSTEIYLPEPEDRDAPYEARVLFTCDPT